MQVSLVETQLGVLLLQLGLVLVVAPHAVPQLHLHAVAHGGAHHVVIHPHCLTL